MPNAENVSEESAIAAKASNGLAIAVPESAANGNSTTAARMNPNKKPASVFPRAIVKKETGATTNLSNVPVCFSSTTATASIDVVPKRMTRAVSPETIRLELICPAIENAKNSETGIKRP